VRIDDSRFALTRVTTYLVYENFASSYGDNGIVNLMDVFITFDYYVNCLTKVGCSPLERKNSIF